MMASNWNVLVETTEDGKAIATVLELPSVQAIADTQNDAIDRAQKLLAERLAQVEIVPIQVEPSTPEPAIAKFAGIFKNDADFAEIVKQMKAEREQLDEE